MRRVALIRKMGIFSFLHRRKKQNVLVNRGVDINQQTFGGKRGEYFGGNQKKIDTYIVQGNKAWQITLDNLSTGERQILRFCKQMCVGRTAKNSPYIVNYVIPRDSHVSRMHCLIYESGDCLCLQNINDYNKTYKNGRLVKEPVYLQNGDKIQVGKTKIQVWFGRG